MFKIESTHPVRSMNMLRNHIWTGGNDKAKASTARKDPGSKGVEVGVVDWCTGSLTFMQESGVHVQSQTCS